MDDQTASQDWYLGFRHWDVDHDRGGRAMRYHLKKFPAVFAEMIGAGIVASEAEQAEWKGESHPSWDVDGDGRLCDVKRAWHHLGNPDILGFPGQHGGFNPASVHEVVLVVISDYTLDHEYLPNGSARITLTSDIPEAVYRIPVTTLNQLMRRYGQSEVTYLVDTNDIEQFRARPFPSHTTPSPTAETSQPSTTQAAPTNVADMFTT